MLKDFMYIVLGAILFLVLTLGATWIGRGNEFFLYKYFAPKQAAVEREVFENTESFKKGMAQELDRLELDYVSGNDEQKQALRFIILQKVAGLDEGILSPHTRSFINTVRNSR